MGAEGDMNVRNLQSLVALVIGFALGYLWHGCTNVCDDPLTEQTVTTTTIDSSLRVTPSLPIVVTESRPNVVRRPGIVTHVDTVRMADTIVRLDTILISEPFVMTLDTITDRGDTVTAITSFPPPEMSIAVRSRPDTAMDRTRIVVVDRPVPQKQSWWVEPAKAGVYIGGGFLAGYITRLATEDNECTQVINQIPAARPALVNVRLTF